MKFKREKVTQQSKETAATTNDRESEKEWKLINSHIYLGQNMREIVKYLYSSYKRNYLITSNNVFFQKILTTSTPGDQRNQKK